MKIAPIPDSITKNSKGDSDGDHDQDSSFFTKTEEPKTEQVAHLERDRARTTSFVRSNTLMRRARSSASRMRKRLTDIEKEVGTQLLKLSTSDYVQKGALSFEEFKLLLQKNCSGHVSEEEARQLMNKYDTNQNGTIELEEFVADHNVSAERFAAFLDAKEVQRQACRACPFNFSAFNIKEVVDNALTSGTMHVSVSTIDELWTWIDQKVVVNTDIQTHSCGKSTGNACIGRSNFIMSNRITLVQRRDESEGFALCNQNSLNSIYVPTGDLLKKISTCQPLIPLVTFCAGCPPSKLGVPICHETANASKSIVTAEAASSNDANSTCVPKAEWNLSQRWPEAVLDDPRHGFELKRIEDHDCFGGLLCLAYDGYAYDLPAGPATEVRKHLTYLRDREWIDNRTTSMDVALVVYSPDFGMLSKSLVEFTFFPGGRIKGSLLVESINDPTDLAVRDTVFTVLWCLLIVAIPVQEVQCRWKKAKGNCKSFWLHPWRVIMVIQVFLLLAMLITWRVAISMTLRYIEVRENYILHQAADLFFFFRAVGVAVILIFLIQFLRSFLAVDQLAILFYTFQTAIFELMNFFIIIVIFLIATTSSSMLIFGSQVSAYSVAIFAIEKNLDGMIGGLDIQEILAVNHIQILALIWWIMYVLFIVIVVFNMMLAIVLRAYEKVYNNHNNARSITNQMTHEFFILRAQCKGWLTLAPIVEIFSEFDALDMNNAVSAGLLYDWLEDRECQALLNNTTYARGYLLALIKEFVEAHDTQSKGHDMRAYKRIDELDRDFEHMHARMDDISVGVVTLVDHLEA